MIQVHAIWTWCQPTIGALGLTNIPEPHYFGLGWPPHTCSLDLVGAKSRRLGSGKHVSPTLLRFGKHASPKLFCNGQHDFLKVERGGKNPWSELLYGPPWHTRLAIVFRVAKCIESRPIKQVSVLF